MGTGSCEFVPFGTGPFGVVPLGFVPGGVVLLGVIPGGVVLFGMVVLYFLVLYQVVFLDPHLVPLLVLLFDHLSFLSDLAYSVLSVGHPLSW